MDESLLIQKIEFLEFELQELKNKEKNHCKINESLIQILGNVEETQLNVRKK